MTSRKIVPVWVALLLFFLLAVVGAACRGGSSSTREVLAVEGSVALTGVAGSELSIDLGLEVVYVGGGFGQLGLVRVDVSDPEAMTVTPFAAGYGGGVAVDPVTHRVATTDAYGATLAIFDSSGALLDQEPIIGCGGSIIAGDGHFGVSTQCVDAFHVYDIAAGAVVLDTRAGGVGSSCQFNAATGRYYMNRTPRAGGAGTDEALVVEPAGGPGGGFVTSDLGVEGHIVGVDASRNRVFLEDVYRRFLPSGGVVALDGTTHAVVAAPGIVEFPSVAVAEGARRIFVSSYAGGDHRVYLVESESLDVVAEIDMMAETGHSLGAPIVTDGKRAYGVGRSSSGDLRLFVVGRRR